VFICQSLPVRRGLTLLAAALVVLGAEGASGATRAEHKAPSAMAFWSGRQGVAAFADYSRCDRSRCPAVLEHTADGGRTWQSAQVPWLAVALHAVEGTRVVFAEVYGRPGGLLRSDDAGVTWRRLGPFTGASFPTNKLGFALRAGAAATTLVHTTDGGRTWNRLRAPCPLMSEGLTAFVSAVHGWLLCLSEPGAGQQLKALFETLNGGRTWALVMDAGLVHRHPSTGAICACGYPHGMSFGAAGFGVLWQSRGLSYRTRDGGRTWSPLPGLEPEIVEAVAGDVVLPERAFVVVRDGRRSGYLLRRSDDAGRTWIVVHRWPMG
jgi:photosystem II stability/assembly factor-like uncharacterized protein